MSPNTAKLIASALKNLEGRKTQKQVAREAGFRRSNFISMLKHGQAAVPIERVPALAEALEIDPALLFRAAMSELWPGYEHVVIAVFGTVLTRREAELIALIRHLTSGNVPKLTPRLEKALKAAFDDEA